MSKMTDEQIKKALKYCQDTEGDSCQCCEYLDVPGCQMELSKDALDLINRQQAEIERLRKAINDMTVNVVKINEHLPLLVAEAIKEHKEQLIFEIVNTPTKKQNCGVFYLNGVADRQLEIIDIIKGCEGKEMVGEGK